MLVLSRKKNEEVLIDLTRLLGSLGVLEAVQANGIEPIVRVAVVEVRGDKVRLGLTADRLIDVHREEVYKQIHGIEETPA